MSWVPPFFTCGECGGEIGRWPMKNLLKQDILDWRHRTVPDGATPHRAVLGTPVPIAELLEAETVPSEAQESQTIPAPEVPARPAMREELPASALSLDRAAGENGWRVEAWYMRGPLMDARWKFSRMVSSLILRMDRDGHRLVASWQADVDPLAHPGWTAKQWPGVPFVTSYNPWSFDEAWSLTRTVEALSSPELKKAVNTPRMICETCGEPPALHLLTATGLMCHAKWVAAMATPTP